MLAMLSACAGQPDTDAAVSLDARAIDAQLDAFVPTDAPDAFVADDSGSDAAIATEELGYDDGTSEVSVVPDITAPGGEVAVQFTPPGYPARLLSARFFVPLVSEPVTEFRVHVYGPAAVDTGPGTSLLSADVRATGTAGDTWVVVDLSPYAISIDSGDFFVAMEWLTVPGPMFMGRSQQLGEDEDGGADMRSWTHNSTTTTWRRLNALPNDVDAMIRATVVLP